MEYSDLYDCHSCINASAPLHLRTATDPVQKCSSPECKISLPSSEIHAINLHEDNIRDWAHFRYTYKDGSACRIHILFWN
jgi:hypothetical protein